MYHRYKKINDGKLIGADLCNKFVYEMKSEIIL